MLELAVETDQNDAVVAFYQKCVFTVRNVEMQRKV